MDLTGASRNKETSEGVTLYPIVSELRFYVTDFYGAEDNVLNRDYAEGWAGHLIIGGDQARLVVSDAPTDTFMIPLYLAPDLPVLAATRSRHRPGISPSCRI
jgi:predicted Abi (CAAX) family protease